MLRKILLVILLGCCAISAERFTGNGFGRVVNGTDSNIESYPYMVSFRVDGSHYCGATLLSPFWALTAAHCVQWFGPGRRYYSIQHSSTVIESGDTTNVITTAQLYIHPNYNAYNSYLHDIALIRLSEPAYVSQYVILPTQFSDVAQGTPSKLLGWGLNATDGIMQTTLQEVDLIVFSDEECRRRHDNIIHSSHICSGVSEGGRGQCTADSGGPLLVNGIEVGLVSWSVKPCAIAPYPGVFTQVSYYREWIRLIAGV